MTDTDKGVNAGAGDEGEGDDDEGLDGWDDRECTDLGTGIFVVGDFKEYTDPKELGRLIEAGREVFVCSTYGGEHRLYFTGTILWDSDDQEETRQYRSVTDLDGARSMGPVPAGTLVVAIDES